MATLTFGTVEYVFVEVNDEADVITSLVGTGPKFDIEDSAGVKHIDQQTAVAVNMQLRCLVDTNLLPSTGEYKLFVNFDSAPEAPRLGPFRIGVVD